MRGSPCKAAVVRHCDYLSQPGSALRQQTRHRIRSRARLSAIQENTTIYVQQGARHYGTSTTIRRPPRKERVPRNTHCSGDWVGLVRPGSARPPERVGEQRVPVTWDSSAEINPLRHLWDRGPDLAPGYGNRRTGHELSPVWRWVQGPRDKRQIMQSSCDTQHKRISRKYIGS